MYKKKYHSKHGIMRKISIALLSGVMVASLGFAAACTTDDNSSDDSSSTPVDTQTILNGNFEFFSDSDDETRIIYTPDSWTASVSGQTNYSMNGIIDTSKRGWDAISASDLATRLEDNYNLDENDENYDDLYVDYNGMRARDIPYADPHSALASDATDEDKALIDNPLTHDIIVNSDGSYSYTDENGDVQPIYVGDDGRYYTDEANTELYESHVLMVHNYRNIDQRYGTAQGYTSSSTVTLDPNTAAEISVWVKTSDLMYNRNGDTPEEGLGAYIAVEQSVGDNTIDTFYIEAINTSNVTENNGWVQYTVYVQGCDFATSVVSIEVGLGLANDDGDYSRVLEGYAFFDDIECTVYPNLSRSENYNEADAAGYIVNSATHDDADTVCTISDSDDEKVFSYDSFKSNADFAAGYGRNFLIDLTSRQERADNALSSANASAALTKDDDNYVTSGSTPSFINVGTKDNGTTLLNHTLNLGTDNDVIGTFTLGTLSGELSSSSSAGAQRYATLIEDVLSNASSLPGASDDTTALMLLSSRGAAYTSTISGENDSFTVEAGGYKMISFWVRTSDMSGFTAATISIYDEADEETSASLTVDTTDITFDAGDEEDIYGGWLQCFFFVENPLDAEKTFKIDFSFGTTSTIKDTTAASYKAGWAAIANVQTFSVDEDVFSLASTGTYAASFSFESTDNRENNYMDSVYGSLSNNIESNITRPSSYDGVNGGSANVVYKDTIDPDNADKRNDNGNAGLINKDYFGNYIEAAQGDSSGSYAWLESLLASNGLQLSQINAANEAAGIWNDIFGSSSVQPLLIVNALRVFDDGTAAMNYGFLASSATTVSSSSYQAITVRVKVSAGAAAYVYLTEDGSRTDISSFSLPKYSFWYDAAGNVLDSEPDYDDDSYEARDHIVYYTREDGLYEDSEGNLYANMYNYSRVYYAEDVEYWAAGADEAVILEEADSDTVYYISKEEAAKTDGTGIQVPHYLVADNSDGTTTRVFRYEDSVYRYIITDTDSDGNSTVSYSEPVSNFVIGSENGGADLRYDNTDTAKQLYSVIDARYDSEGRLFGGATAETANLSALGYDKNGNYVADTWQTVTFYVHTGDEEVSYSLELWSGARETSGVTTDGTTHTVNNDGSVPGSYVIFDYSNETVDESTFGNLTTAYSDEIKAGYLEIFREYGLLSKGLIKDTEQNISYYKNLYDGFVESGKLVPADIADNENVKDSYDKITSYEAMYYTYSLYDDAGYVPFNMDTAADGETGYNYNPDDYSETLVYLSISDRENNSMSVFVDYSATDVTVESGTVDDGGSTDDTTTESDTNVWLLVASIVLAVVLIFTLISIFVRDLIKKRRRNRKYVKNVYSGKRKHYIRKLGITESAVEEGAKDGEGEATESQANEAPAENAEDNADDAEADAPAETTESADEGSSEEAESEKSEGEDK